MKTGVRECIRLTLDNGEEIICTPEHPFLRLDQRYVRADELTAETAIMPLYLRQRHDRPEAYQPVLSYWHAVHRMVALGTQPGAFLGGLGTHSKRSRGMTFEMAVHHKDRDKQNNHPSNLEIMKFNDHNRLHSSDARETLAKLWADPAFREKQREAASRSAREHWDSKTKRFAKIEGMKRAWKGNDARKVALAELGRRDKSGAKNPNYRHGRCVKNHRIVSIEAVGERPVYDLKIERHHNFAVAAGVFVHNSGNHYVDLFTDEEDRAWIGVHFGSRKLGHKIATEYVKRAGGGQGINAAPALLEDGSADGEEYKLAMQLAGRYAYAGRDWVCARVAKILGAEILEEVHNHHNFAWRETHDGEELWVVRKGATPAFPGQRGFVGATMAEPSVILEGVESEEARAALYSTVHGAGRMMSRTKAAGKVKWVKNPDWTEGGREPRKIRKRIRDGEISTEERLADVRSAGVTLRGSGNDEAMRAYKRLDEVIAAHGDSIRIVHTLTPVGVAMAGSGERD